MENDNQSTSDKTRTYLIKYFYIKIYFYIVAIL